VKTDAWEIQKKVYLKGASLFDTPVREELIPHKYAEGADGPTVPVYVRLPTHASRESPVPAILLITGLDGYRPDNTQRSQEFVNRGWGCVIAEIPGTADCPADPKDPKSPDRLWSSVLDWMASQGIFDMTKIIAWGLSCGGHYAIRIAHTHRERLRGSVGQGAGTHHFFGKEWLKKIDDHEYPFAYVLVAAYRYCFAWLAG
jgi:dienelactone hydrolase